MAYWSDSSVSMAPQSAFGTVNSTAGDFEAIKCETPTMSLDTAITELNLLTGQVGAAPERLIGRRSGKFSFKMPLEGFKNGYDPDVAVPGAAGVLPHWAAIAANVIGSQNSSIVSAATMWAGAHLNNGTTHNSGVTSATTSAITFDAAGDWADIDAGCLVATAESKTSTTMQLGFAKSVAGNVITLFEASKNAVNSATADVLPSASMWLSTGAYTPVPMTIRFTGADTTFCYILQDWICTGFSITWNSGEVPTITFSGQFYNFSMDTTLGGLQVPDAFDRIPQIVGAVNGYATIAGSQVCGLESCTLDYAIEVVEVPCHAATQGVSAVAYRNPRVKVSAQVLHNSTDSVFDAAGTVATAGQHQWQSFLERGEQYSFSCYVGAKAGKAWAFNVPKGLFTAVTAEKRGEYLAYKLDVEAAAYSGDSALHAETTANSPINSVFRMALA